ncbi:MAG TPA: hypothetical protein VMQ17_11245 [Candidatus Sulfotelmatobacter sp.]|nr:hypothetical protein [Candidatus Sulfotelmatobacter sp.]
MTDDRKSGLALIAGSIGLIITMAFHPTGHDLLAPGQFDRIARLIVAVHTLALASIPVMFLGTLGLSRRLASPDKLSVCAVVAYGFAGVAALNAAAFSGLVAPGLARQMAAATPASETANLWSVLFTYNGFLNQAFAMVFVVASSTSLALWSVAILRNGLLARSVAVYGCILGPLTVAAVLSGHLRLNVHGFGLVVLGQAVWFVIVGVTLCRPGTSHAPGS